MLYDLTAGKGKKRATSAAEIKRRTAAAAFNVATVVHEATHQIAFNSRLARALRRQSTLAHRGDGDVFRDARSRWRPRLEDDRARSIARGTTGFSSFVRHRRKRDSLSTLISQTDRFTDSHKAADAYAEAWALTYFLNAKHPDEYVAYLKRLATKQPLIWDEPEARLADFKTALWRQAYRARRGVSSLHAVAAEALSELRGSSRSLLAEDRLLAIGADRDDFDRSADEFGNCFDVLLRGGGKVFVPSRTPEMSHIQPGSVR